MFLAVLVYAVASFAQDIVGSIGCSMPICVLSNPYLRFGTGAESSVNAWGLFQQPWYYSPSTSTWYKLTYSNYPLDTAIGTGMTGPNWSGTTVIDLYTLTNTGSSTNYSGFIVDTSDTTKSVGHGIIVSMRQFTVLGQLILFQNTFSLGANDSFVRITTRVINNSTTDITNMFLWTGTRDDYVGSTDVNTKTRGNLDTGSFVAISANNQSSRAIMITNPTDGVLFYSETAGVMTSYSVCCSFSNAYNTNPLNLAPKTLTPTDGSYAAVLPIGNISIGGSGSITWYYAAGVISSLNSVAESVSVAQAVFAGTASTATATATASTTATAASTSTAKESKSASVSSSISATARGSPSSHPTRTPTPSVSVSKSVSSSAFRSPISTWTPIYTVSSMFTISASRSVYSTSVVTSTGTASASATSTPSPTQTPSTTSTLAIKVLIAQIPPIQVNFTPTFTSSTVILEINKSDNLVYIPISLIILAGIGYAIWKARKKSLEAVEKPSSTPSSSSKSILKQNTSKLNIQIREPNNAVHI
jgi:hypothetical protein